jgi:hypothetical protein
MLPLPRAPCTRRRLGGAGVVITHARAAISPLLPTQRSVNRGRAAFVQRTATTATSGPLRRLANRGRPDRRRTLSRPFAGRSRQTFAPGVYRVGTLSREQHVLRGRANGHAAPIHGHA